MKFYVHHFYVPGPWLLVGWCINNDSPFHCSMKNVVALRLGLN
jgi:hypothetical protein